MGMQRDNALSLWLLFSRWNTAAQTFLLPCEARPALSHTKINGRIALACRVVRASIRMEAGSSVSDMEAARAHSTAYEYLCHLEETRT